MDAAKTIRDMIGKDGFPRERLEWLLDNHDSTTMELREFNPPDIAVFRARASVDPVNHFSDICSAADQLGLELSKGRDHEYRLWSVRGMPRHYSSPEQVSRYNPNKGKYCVAVVRGNEIRMDVHYERSRELFERVSKIYGN
jgi:hypothetical protein